MSDNNKSHISCNHMVPLGHTELILIEKMILWDKSINLEKQQLNSNTLKPAQTHYLNFNWLESIEWLISLINLEQGHNIEHTADKYWNEVDISR